jgi:hypothetical protein
VKTDNSYLRAKLGEGVGHRFSQFAAAAGDNDCLSLYVEE